MSDVSIRLKLRDRMVTLAEAEALAEALERIANAGNWASPATDPAEKRAWASAAIVAYRSRHPKETP